MRKYRTQARLRRLETSEGYLAAATASRRIGADGGRRRVDDSSGAPAPAPAALDAVEVGRRVVDPRRLAEIARFQLADGSQHMGREYSSRRAGIRASSLPSSARVRQVERGARRHGLLAGAPKAIGRHDLSSWRQVGAAGRAAGSGRATSAMRRAARPRWRRGRRVALGGQGGPANWSATGEDRRGQNNEPLTAR